MNQADSEAMCCYVRDPLDEHWLRFEHPKAVLSASTPDTLETLLVEIEAAADQGFKVVGFLAYEAAEALDERLSTHSSSAPLAMFGVFDHWEVLTSLPVIAPGVLSLEPVVSETPIKAKSIESKSGSLEVRATKST